MHRVESESYVPGLTTTELAAISPGANGEPGFVLRQAIAVRLANAEQYLRETKTSLAALQSLHPDFHGPELSARIAQAGAVVARMEAQVVALRERGKQCASSDSVQVLREHYTVISGITKDLQLAQRELGLVA